MLIKLVKGGKVRVAGDGGVEVEKVSVHTAAVVVALPNRNEPTRTRSETVSAIQVVPVLADLAEARLRARVLALPAVGPTRAVETVSNEEVALAQLRRTAQARCTAIRVEDEDGHIAVLARTRVLSSTHRQRCGLCGLFSLLKCGTTFARAEAQPVIAVGVIRALGVKVVAAIAAVAALRLVLDTVRVARVGCWGGGLAEADVVEAQGQGWVVTRGIEGVHTTTLCAAGSLIHSSVCLALGWWHGCGGGCGGCE